MFRKILGLSLLALGNSVLAQGTPPAAPLPDPQVIIKRGKLDVQEMLGADAPKPTITTVEGQSATTIRNAGKGIGADVGAELALPRPLTWAELLRIEPDLPKHVPWLGGLAEPKVSPLFHAHYRAKWEESNRRMLEGMPAETPAQFYDLAGAWELPAADGRPSILVVRGKFTPRPSTEPGEALSGPITNPTAIEFNPRTAYRWKGGTPPNLADKVKTALRLQTELKREYAITGLPRARNRELEAGLAQRQAELEDLPKWNYLGSQEIPFFSLPLLFRQYPEYAFAPSLGDAAVVITGTNITPALYGDELTDSHLGQVSEALAGKLNTSGPVSLTVLIFTGTATAEPGPVTVDILRERAGKYVPLPEPPPPPTVAAPPLAPTAVPTPAPPVEAVVPDPGAVPAP